MNQPVTKTALATLGMDALDRDRVGQVAVSAIAGGVSFASALEVMEFAKLMAISDKAVPPHLRNNPGMCLAVSFQAVEWRMSPFSVANKSYVVNDRIAYESQLIHAIIEARAPLAKRLECRYEGDGPTRRIIVTGTFTDGEVREYTSPEFKDILVKNSPSWRGDVDQQFWYFGSRAWCRKWCSDVILGIYSRDELAAIPNLGREEEPIGPTLAERLGTADRSEGHQPDHVTTELNNIAPGTKQEILPPEKQQQPAAETATDAEQPAKPKRSLRGKRKPPEANAAAPSSEASGDPTDDQPKTEEPAGPPTTAGEYQPYALAWIDAEEDKAAALARWEQEDEMRNTMQVGVRIRIALKGRLNFKFGIED